MYITYYIEGKKCDKTLQKITDNDIYLKNNHAKAERIVYG